MSKMIPAKLVKNSSYLKSAQKKSSDYINNPKKIQVLLDKAVQKISKSRGVLSDVGDSLGVFIRLMRAYGSGQYNTIALKSVLLILASLIYFVMPVDAIPDVLLGFGYIDDVALLGWTISAVKQEIEKFSDWELSHGLKDDCVRSGKIL